MEVWRRRDARFHVQRCGKWEIQSVPLLPHLNVQIYIINHIRAASAWEILRGTAAVYGACVVAVRAVLWASHLVPAGTVAPHPPGALRAALPVSYTV